MRRSPLDYHHRFFTSTPPTLAEFQGASRVADDYFFNDHFPPVLQVNDERVALEWDSMPHWRVPEEATDRLIATLERAVSANLEYAHLVTARTSG